MRSPRRVLLPRELDCIEQASLCRCSLVLTCVCAFPHTFWLLRSPRLEHRFQVGGREVTRRHDTYSSLEVICTSARVQSDQLIEIEVRERDSH